MRNPRTTRIMRSWWGTVSFLLLSSIVCLAETNTTTYRLLYDGFVTLDQKESSTTSTAKPLSTGIVDDIIQLLHSLLSSGSPTQKTESEQQYCHQLKHRLESRCICSYSIQGMSLNAETVLYGEATKSLNVAARIAVTLSCTPQLAREVLVQSVSKIDSRFDKSDTTSVWSIQHEPCANEIDQSMGTVPSQIEKYLRTGSIDTILLSNRYTHKKQRIASTSTLPPEHKEMEASCSAGITQPQIELWQYQEIGSDSMVQALFIDSHLAFTTLPAGSANAEALVHPALISHPDPSRVAIISLTPAAIVKEVMKHKSVTLVELVGASEVAIDMMKEHVNTAFDCSNLVGITDNCFDMESVHMVQESAESWVNNTAAACETALKERNETDPLHADAPFFDVIILDIPRYTDEWLSPSFQDELRYLLDDESILVVNSGSAPALEFAGKRNTVLSARDEFLMEGIAINEYFASLVYDEPAAVPLDSSYIIAFADYGVSYNRFVRKNSPAIDVDIVDRFRERINKNKLPTVVYDGPTHSGYLTNSRSWQNWYCNTSPGKDFYPCKHFLLRWFDASFHHYNTVVRHDPVKGRSLYTMEDIPKGHFVLPHDSALSIRLTTEQWDALQRFVEDFPDADMYRQFRDFILAYGYQADSLGATGWSVAIACNNTFSNHACSEQDQKTTHVSEYEGDVKIDIFSPVLARRPELLSSITIAKRDIQAGEEIMIDYTSFRSEADPEFLSFLKTICDDGIGLVPVEEKDKK